MSGMFGGMTTTGGGRRKRGATTAQKDETASNASSQALDQQAQQAQEEQNRRDDQLRLRLKNFYNYYNPTKLDGIEKTVEMFRGNETKLFDMLNTKYGPEPSDDMMERFMAEKEAKDAAKNAKTSTGLKRRTAQQQHADPSVVSTATSTPRGGNNNNNNSNGERRKSDSQASSHAGGWGESTTTDNNNTTNNTGAFGFGTSENGDATSNSGWGADNNDTTTATTGGGFGFGGDAGAENLGGGGGFSFGGEPAAETVGGGGSGFGFGSTDDTSAAADTNTAGGGFGFGASTTEAENTNGGGGFGFGGGDAATTTDAGETAGSGFGFGGGDATADDQQQAGGGSGFGATKSDSDDDSDADAVELIDRRLNKSLSRLTSKRDALAEIIFNLASCVSDRRTTLQNCLDLEAKVDDLTQKEQYDAAEEANNELQQAAKKIAVFDQDWQECTRRLEGIADEIKSSINDSSRSFAEERSSLTQLRAEEERKINSYITDQTHKVDSAASKIKVDLDKAVRAQSHVEQDLEDLKKRKNEIESKIAEQTKGLRAEKEKVTADTDRLEEEIRDLEKLLASKKRQLSEKNGNLEDLNHKLDLITKNHQEVMNTVLESMAEEETHLRVCKSRVEDITNQKKTNEEENEALLEEKRVMKRDLEQHAEKINILEKQSQTLATDVSIGFSGFFKKVIRSMSEVRGKDGKFCLMVPYTVPGEEDQAESNNNNNAAASSSSDASSQLQALKSSLSKLERQLTLKSDENAVLLSRLQEIQRAIPAIETAKKQAAAAKQFKEAQAKTAELKKLSEEKETINSQMSSLTTEMESLRKEIDQVTVQKNAEAKKFRASMRSFMDKYSSILRTAAATIERTDDLSFLLIDDLLKLEEGNSTTDEEKKTALRRAANQLLDNLFAELASVCEVPESELRKGSVNPESTASSPAKSPVPEQKKTVAAAEPAVVKQEESLEEEKEEEEEATKEEPGVPAMTKDEMQEKIEALNKAQESAMEEENYELCDQLQTEIDDLEAKMKAF